MSDSPPIRLLLSILTWILIAFVLYASVRLLPGMPTLDGGADASSGVQAWLGAQHRADPLPLGFARWLGDLLRLDLGLSISVQPGRPVAELIAAALPWTAFLGSISILAVLGLALPVGGITAWAPASPISRALAACLYLLHSLPVFAVALLLQQTLAGRLRLLPALGPSPSPEGAGAMVPAGLPGAAAHWVLPVASLALGSLAFVIRFVRASMLEGMQERWALAASAHGASRARILGRHAAPHAAYPLITLVGLMLPGAIAGSVVIESIFALPGMGRLFLTAVARRDYPVVLAAALLVAAMTIASGRLIDAIQRRVDPRLDGRRAGGASA